MKLNKNQVKARMTPWLLASLLLALLIPLAACTALPKTLTVVTPLAPPPLPEQAKQPKLPAWCTPTCSKGWQKMLERQNAQGEKLLLGSTVPTSPGLPASTPTR